MFQKVCYINILIYIMFIFILLGKGVLGVVSTWRAEDDPQEPVPSSTLPDPGSNSGRRVWQPAPLSTEPPHRLWFKKIMKIHQLSLWGIIEMTHFMGCLFVAGSCSVGPDWYKLCSPGWPRAILLLQPPGCWDSGVSPRPHIPQVLKHTHEIRTLTWKLRTAVCTNRQMNRG